LSALSAGGSAKCLISATSTTSIQPAAELFTAAGLACAVAAVALWLASDRLLAVVAQPLLVSFIAVTTLLVAHATTLGAAMVAAVGYQTVGLYAGYFLSRAATVAHVVLGSAGFAGGLAVSGLPRATPAWLTVSIATALTSLTLSHLIAKLHRLADEDPVTGSLSRGGLAKAAEPLLAAAARYGQPLSAVVIDLDGFKQVNDTAGHAAGDRLLADVAARWRAQLRGADVLARSGGDEFVVLAPSTGVEGAARLAERLTGGAGAACSAGTASYRPGDTLSSLLSRADAAMYQVKGWRKTVPEPADGRRGASRWPPREATRDGAAAGAGGTEAGG
jgi:diguanylate cyclase (GGDEF)-like protein